MKSKVIITGAAGGMGRACARLFGNAHDLVLTDLATDSLEGFASELRDDGFSVQAIAGDCGSDAVLSQLADALDGKRPFTLVHTAGIGPSQPDWRVIMDVNLISVERLIRALESKLVPGSVGVLVASTAGYMMPSTPELLSLVGDPLAPDFLDKLAPIFVEMAPHAGPTGDRGLAYVVSKFGVQHMVERHAGSWGEKGARIASISPGLIMTPMGRREIVTSAGAAEHGDAAALGRRGTPMDIAIVAQFLASDAAAYVTGTDIRVDGGSIAVERQRSG